MWKADEIFVFSDLKGATPCNGLFSWLEEKNFYRCYRCQPTMLVCAINHKNLSLDLLLEKVLEAKDKGIQSLDVY